MVFPIRILFVCTGNIARSQMAEGLARHIGGNRIEVYSAGARPNPNGVHPYAIQVMRERGIDISHHRQKGINEVPAKQDVVVTVCDDAAKTCPSLRGLVQTVHWSIPDPGAITAEPVEERLAFFRKIRDDLERSIRELICGLPGSKSD